ncbi:MAG: AAA family ATPase [Chloroflexota bacterium]
MTQPLTNPPTSKADLLRHNISQTLEMLRQYEEKQRLEDDPRRLAKIRHNIEREEQELARLKQKLANLGKPTSPQPLAPAPTNYAANPFFIGGRINQPNHFFGRQRLLRELRQALQKRSNVSLVGGSQMGKSSLLYHLYHSRAEWLPDTTVAYIDLQGVLDEADFCETMLGKLGQAGDSLRQLKRTLEGRDVVLLFDEMERLTDPDFNPRLHDLLRSLSQQRRLAFCVATQQPMEIAFAPRPGHKLSPFHNVFMSRQLGPFSDAEARHLLTTKLQPFPNLFSLREIEELLTASKLHPAKLQQAAHQLFQQKIT